MGGGYDEHGRTVEDYAIMAQQGGLQQQSQVFFCFFFCIAVPQALRVKRVQRMDTHEHLHAGAAFRALI